MAWSQRRSFLFLTRPAVTIREPLARLHGDWPSHASIWHLDPDRSARSASPWMPGQCTISEVLVARPAGMPWKWCELRRESPGQCQEKCQKRQWKPLRPRLAFVGFCPKHCASTPVSQHEASLVCVLLVSFTTESEAKGGSAIRQRPASSSAACGL